MKPIHSSLAIGLLALSLRPAFGAGGTPAIGFQGGIRMGLIPHMDVPDRLAQSDVVVVARFTETAFGPSNLGTARLHIDRIIKGEARISSADIPFGEFRQSEPAPPRYGIFFLKYHDNTLGLTFANEFCLPAAPPKYYVKVDAPDQTHQLAAELANVFMVPPDAILDPKSGLRPGIDLTDVQNGRDAAGERVFKLERPTDALLAARPYSGADAALKDIPRAIRLPYILKVLDSHGPALGRVWAYVAALEAGDRSHLRSEDKYLLHPDERDAGTNEGLQLALERMRVTEQDAPFFAMLMGSTNEWIREAGAFVLRNMKSDVALRAFEVGLRDEDPEVRTYAMAGVCGQMTACGDEKESVLAQPANIPRIAAAYHAWLASRPH